MRLVVAAARGIIERKGLSKVRHMNTDVLWLQEQAARGLLSLCKVLGTENVLDLMSKNMTAATILGYLQRMGLQYTEGRSDISTAAARYSRARVREGVAVANCWGIVRQRHVYVSWE